MLWNNALWLDDSTQMTIFSQSECFISVYKRYAKLKMCHTITITIPLLILGFADCWSVALLLKYLLIPFMIGLMARCTYGCTIYDLSFSSLADMSYSAIANMYVGTLVLEIWLFDFARSLADFSSPRLSNFFSWFQIFFFGRFIVSFQSRFLSFCLKEKTVLRIY